MAGSTNENSHHLTIDANKYLYNLVKLSKTTITANEAVELLFSSLTEKPEIQKPLNKKRPGTSTAKGSWHCHKCHSSFTLLSNLKRHLNNKNIHPDVKANKLQSERVTCGDCGQSYRNKGNLNRHISHCRGKDSNYMSSDGDQNIGKKSLLHHKSEPNQTSNNCNKAERLPCGSCDKTFRRKSHLEWHLDSWHDVNRASDCDSDKHEHSEAEDKDYVPGEDLTSSSKTNSGSALKQIPNGSKRFPCGKCGKIYQTPVSLEIHKYRHHESDTESDSNFAYSDDGFDAEGYLM